MEDNWPRIIAHADMDAFYASVEQLDDPALRGYPVIIGPKSARGVVLTASYEARKFGVTSAMPMAEARRRCPEGLIVPPRFERYQELSELIMGVFDNFSPSVEAISLDEAFIEMTGAEGIFGSPKCMATLIQEAVFEVTKGLTASVGIASTKYVAKVASAFNKPNGVTVVHPKDAVAWLDSMPVSRLWGAGKKTVPRIERLGLHTIGDVRRADPEFLRINLGSAGAHFQTLARAEDPRRVASRGVAKSMGSDRTLSKDVSSRKDIEHYLRQSADRVGRRLRDKNYRSSGVRVKLKTSAFQLLTRQALLAEPTDCSDRLFEVASGLLDQFEGAGPFRLVGLAAYDLVIQGDPVQLGLITDDGKPQALQKTVDEIIHRFGKDVVMRAKDMHNTGTVADTTPNLDFVSKVSSDPT